MMFACLCVLWHVCGGKRTILSSQILYGLNLGQKVCVSSSFIYQALLLAHFYKSILSYGMIVKILFLEGHFIRYREKNQIFIQNFIEELYKN